MNRQHTVSKVKPDRKPAGAWILWGAFVVFAVAQVVWLTMDRRPVTEERHYFAAARIAHGLRGTPIGRAYPDLGNNSPYPPLPAYYTGAVLALTRCNSDVAVLSLLPFAGLLLWAVWKTGCLFTSGEAAAAGAVLVLCFHHFIDVEPLCAPYTFLTEYMLDLPLSALTATALYYLIRCLRAPRGAPFVPSWVLLGLAVGASLLVKVSAPVYLAIAGAALLAEGLRDGTRWLALWRPAVLAIVIALPWYVLHLDDVSGYLWHHEFNTGLALRDGMPSVGTLDNVMYYLQALHSMLSTPFVVLVGVSLVLVVARRAPGRRLVVTGAFLSYLVLTMLWGKSWRFMTPCLVYLGLAVALAVEAVVRRKAIRRLVVYGIVVAACLRMGLMFGIGSATTFAHGSVVHLAPVPSDGGIERIMQDVLRERDPELRLRISVVPVLRRFRHASFMQYAIEHRLPMVYESEWRIRGDAWRDELERSEFIITRTGYNGPARYVTHRGEIEPWLHERLGQSVRLVNVYPLADGTIARLYKQARSFTTWRRHPAAEPGPVKVNFDDTILLTSCDVENDGTRLAVRCTWETRSVPAKEYRLFIQLRDGWRNVVARSFTPGDGLLPVVRWKKNERLVETYYLPLPAEGHVDAVWLGWNRRFLRLPVTESVYPEWMNAVQIAPIP